MYPARVRLSQVMACALLVTACGGRKPPETPAPDDSAPPNSPAPASTVSAPSTSSSMRGGDAAAARAALAEPIYFGFDRTDLTDASRARLDRKAELLRNNPDVRLVIAGHTDERGSTEYNLALGMRRAAESKRYLVSRGIPDGNLDVMSHGEERPADPGHNEGAWAANRRAEFDLTAGTLATSE
ncbi:MAG TPA: OmpA family protein [Gemmatimonadales bacterium]|nr:OmpA family protein [Gemmatimonadales bacterium]